MIRFVLYFLGICALAAGAVWFADNPGRVQIEWLGWEAEPTVGILLLVLLIVGALIYGLLALVRLALRGPKAFADYRAARRRVKREQALVRGFAAVAIGEADVAKRHLAAARASASGQGLGQMLRAQIAVLENDHAEAESAYRALLGNPDTEFLGLRGLFETAARQGDRAAALEFATRAFHLKPRSAWVAETLFRLQTQGGQWDNALKTLATARRAGGVTGGEAKRREAVILVAEAMSAEAQADRPKALGLAQRAFSADPKLFQAAAIVARVQAAQGQDWSAAGTIEAAWRAFPHPALAEAYAALRPDDTPEQTSKRLIGLGQFNGRHVESRILIASEALKLGDVRRARRTLKDVIEAPSARLCLLMGEIEDRDGNEAGALVWRTKAIIAPRDNEWTCSSCGREFAVWHPVCDGCGGFDTLGWGSEGSFGTGELVVLPPEAEAAIGPPVEALAKPAPAGTQSAEPKTDAAPRPPLPAETKRAEPAAPDIEIFVPPRPPDDPGTEDLEAARYGSRL